MREINLENGMPVESWDQNPLLRNKVSLGLLMVLKTMREHVIMHRDACSLSSLKGRGILDFSRAKVFL